MVDEDLVEPRCRSASVTMQSAVKQLMEATLDTAAATPASRPGVVVRRRRQNLPPPPPRWRVLLNQLQASDLSHAFRRLTV